jgi:ankyrin repeat protein
MPSSKPTRPACLRLCSWGLGLCAVVQLSGCATAPAQLALRQRLEAGVQTPEDTLRFQTSREEQQQLVASAQDWPLATPSTHTHSTDTTTAGAALMKAASTGDLGATKAALLGGARVNTSNTWGSTPVLLAAKEGHADVVRTLLRAGASANGRGGAMTPLAAAALGGHTEVIKLLLGSGAEADTSTESGESALMLAVRMNRVPAAAALLEAGASLQVHNRQGDGPVMVAIAEDFPAMLALLLKHGASPNSPDRDGLTPLYWAEYLKRDALAQLLLASGAHPQVKKIALPTSGSYAFGEF